MEPKYSASMCILQRYYCGLIQNVVSENINTAPINYFNFQNIVITNNKISLDYKEILQNMWQNL